jgi:hypothetical protein
MVNNAPNQKSAGNRRHGDEGTGYFDNTLWQQLTEADTDEEFCYSWLGLQSSIIGGVYSGVVVLGPSEKGYFDPVAFWPMGLRVRGSLTGITERVLKEKKGIVIKTEADNSTVSPEKGCFQVAFPVRGGGKLYGVAALEITSRPHDHLQSAMRRLQWGIAWLEKWVICKDSEKNSRVNERLTNALDLTVHTLQEDRFQAAATSFVTLLATRLGCDRVSIGFIKGKKIKVQALSHSAQFKKQMNLIRSIGAAMDESIDQQKALIYPVASEGDSGDILYAHDELARQQGHSTVCTIPFMDKEGNGYGALTLERSPDKPFNTGEVELCDSISALVAPILEEKRKNDRFLIRKIAESLRLQVEKLIGPGHMAVKLSSVVILVLIILFTFAKGEYRVTAKSTIEGKVQRAIVAPYDGYIYESHVRAGDSVKEGQVMSKLDDRDFRLEHLKWESQRYQYLRQYREAMAKGNRADMKILKEQVNQADAQLALLDEQLSRAKLLATFDGVVVSGDLSQSLGAPVERGQVLFEISPLHDYRVKLEVDEREISQIKVGQTGYIVLNALPKTRLPITVEKITPVSTAEEGVNYFNVEAGLGVVSERLRPGMEGFGKVCVERRRLIWISTHDIADWVRLWAWSWWP